MEAAFSEDVKIEGEERLNGYYPHDQNHPASFTLSYMTREYIKENSAHSTKHHRIPGGVRYN
ncbi:hypothetical protein [Salinibacillus kushneri]|uniref:hypothetical protein n=1 Tax=Salinibacillus kushneri TaxID=237682 RepID=UPI001C654B3E|nr:hypothetical protein [Salinibacillus kushneri]